MSGQPEGGSGPLRSPRKAAETCPPAGPAAQPSIEQPHVEIEAVTQAEEPSPSGPGGVRGAPPKRLTPLAVGSRAQPWSLFGYFLANQKVTPRRVGGQGIYIFSYAPTYSNHQNWRHTAGRGAFSAAEAPKTQEALMAFKFLGQRQLGKLPSRWVSTILMVAISTTKQWEKKRMDNPRENL